jgi:adenylate cyclase
MNPSGRWTSWLDRVSGLGRRPEDGDDERARKALLAWFGVFVGFGAPLDGIPALGAGLWLQAGLSLLNGAVVLLGLWYMAATGHRQLFQRIALATTLLLPSALHVAMGGFAASNGMVLWAMFAPLGALLLGSRAEARLWAAAYVAVASTAWAMEAFAPTVRWIEPSADPAWSRAGLYFGLPGMAVALVWVFVSETERAKAEAAREHARAERLLLNILPAPIAARLKDDTGTIADGFSAVSVLFADIVGFTGLSARTRPEQLVALLDEVFSAFDAAADRRGCEKIKTIGDAYMAAAGLPTGRDDHADALAALSLDLFDALAAINARHGTALDLRIGIHSGPVVAGVIGQRKFSYDLWGDTVNTASRMESHGVAGRVQLTEATMRELTARFRTEPRGTIKVKGKGPMNVYLLAPRHGDPSDGPEEGP